MSDDKALLLKAAKAAGITVEWDEQTQQPVRVGPEGWREGFWNPRDDDADALRLAVKLRISPQFDERGKVFTGYERTKRWDEPIIEKLGDDSCAATRRAIVRAAAAKVGDGKDETP